MSFPRYENYKDSGVEWLGEVPDSWEISRLGFESWVRARLGWRGLKAEEYVDDGFIFLSTPNIKLRNIDFDNVNYITEERYAESPEIQLRKGDVLLAKDGSTLGTVNVVRSLSRGATVNSSIAVITPNTTTDGVYLHYLFKSRFMDATVQRIKGGMGVPHLFQEDLRKFYVPVPPMSEQRQIASFLDDETGKIEWLIEEQQRLIDLLNEKRQAVIAHAVTKGLNSDAPMKDSGTFWIGNVPKHWGVSSLRYFGRFSSGSTPDRTKESYWGGDIPWVKTGEIYYAVINNTEEMITAEGMAESSVTLAPAGSMLLALYGQGVTRGRVAMLGVDATFNQACVAIESDKRMDRAYLFAFFVFRLSVHSRNRQ